MSLQIARVELAAGAGVPGRVPCQQTCAPQTEEALFRRAGPPFEHRRHALAQRRSASQERQQAAQMVAEDPVALGRARLDLPEADATRRHLMKGLARQIRMPSYQMEEPRGLRVVPQGAAI